MKRNSQKPNSDSLWMIRVLSSQVILRLSFMFLKMNHSSFLKKMNENRNKLPTETVKDHKRKITFLMDKMYPKLEPFEAFRRYEKFLGHDLLVKSIMSLSKVGVNKPQFSNCIPEVQWKKFKQDVKQDRKDDPVTPESRQKPTKPGTTTVKKPKSVQANEQSRKKGTNKKSDPHDRKPAAVSKLSAPSKSSTKRKRNESMSPVKKKTCS